jgi:hypothetical protein
VIYGTSQLSPPRRPSGTGGTAANNSALLAVWPRPVPFVVQLSAVYAHRLRTEASLRCLVVVRAKSDSPERRRRITARPLLRLDGDTPAREARRTKPRPAIWPRSRPTSLPGAYVEAHPRSARTTSLESDAPGLVDAALQRCDVPSRARGESARQPTQESSGRTPPVAVVAAALICGRWPTLR